MTFASLRRHRLAAALLAAWVSACAGASLPADEDGGLPAADGGVVSDGGRPTDGGFVDAGLPPDDGGIFGEPNVRLDALPPGLGFDCIAPGCNQTKTVRLTAGGPGPVRIYAVQLDLASSADFRLAANRPPPYDLAQGATEDVGVVYVPSDARVDTGALLVDYGSPSSRVRGRMRIELEARVIGTAVASVQPTSLSFGFVPMGTVGQLDVVLTNAGTGNAVLEVTEAKVLAGPNFTVTPAAPPNILLGNAAEKRFTVGYAPTTRGVHTDKLILKTSDLVTPTIEVPLRGTSIDGASAVVTPTGPIALGDVRVDDSATAMVTLSNQGGQPLTVSALTFSGAGAAHLQVSPAAADLGAIAPFDATTLVVRYTPTATGVHDATLTIATNDPTQPTIPVAITARGINPRLVVTPAMVSFGQAVLGWNRGPTTVSARNEGFGPLQIQRVYMAPGSSTEVTLSTLPGLPITLNQGNRLDLELSYSAVTLSNVAARLVIESDDPRNARVEVPATAVGVTCEQGCPLANATPRCDSGQCAISTCNSGYLNANGTVSDGCECRVESPERSNLCGDAEFLGSFSDEGSSRTVTGQLSTKGDIDWFNAYGIDTGGIGELFGDDYDFRVTLSGPAGYKMCVFKVERGQHEAVCPGGVDGACSGNTSYSDGGSWGSADDADYFIKVYNDGSGPTCGSFTLTIRNG